MLPIETNHTFPGLINIKLSQLTLQHQTMQIFVMQIKMLYEEDRGTSKDAQVPEVQGLEKVNIFKYIPWSKVLKGAKLIKFYLVIQAKAPTRWHVPKILGLDMCTWLDVGAQL